MKNKIKHRLLTFIVFVIIVSLSLYLGDGYNTDWKDYLATPSWIISILFLYGREAGLLNLPYEKKWDS